MCLVIGDEMVALHFLDVLASLSPGLLCNWVTSTKHGLGVLETWQGSVVVFQIPDGVYNITAMSQWKGTGRVPRLISLYYRCGVLGAPGIWPISM